MGLSRRLRLPILIMLSVVLVGVIGYMTIEGWPLIDALYMTIITITTVGFKEARPLSEVGKIFTIILIIGGIIGAAYTLGSVLEFMVEGYFRDILGGKRMKNRISALKDHYIVCGFGRVGQQIVREFKRSGSNFIVLDNNPKAIRQLEQEGVLYIQGNASDDYILKEAGIDNAKGLVTVVDSDEDNVYVTLTARVLNPNIFIIARANLEGSEEKLKRAGADRVISPYSLGGRRIASMILKPVVSDFLDTVMHGEEIEFQLEELPVGDRSVFKDKTIADANIRQKCGAMILSIQRNGKFDIDMGPSTIIKEGDKIVAIGTRQQLDKLEDMA